MLTLSTVIHELQDDLVNGTQVARQKPAVLTENSFVLPWQEGGVTVPSNLFPSYFDFFAAAFLAAGRTALGVTVGTGTTDLIFDFLDALGFHAVADEVALGLGTTSNTFTSAFALGKNTASNSASASAVYTAKRCMLGTEEWQPV